MKQSIFLTAFQRAQKNALKKCLCIIFNAALCILQISCANSETRPATVVFPQWPPENKNNWPPLSEWNITVTDGATSENFTITAERESITLELNSSAPVSVLVRPLVCGKEFFEPAGMIFPYEKNISWESGFCTETLQKFYLNAMISNSKENCRNYAAKFNWEKFIQTINTKIKDSKKFYNPWLLNQEDILTSISAENFSASKFTIKKTKNFSSEKLFNTLQKTPLHSYIPQNISFSEESETFSLSTLKLNKFLLYDESEFFNSKIVTVSVQDSTFSLAVNSLPL